MVHSLLSMHCSEHHLVFLYSFTVPLAPVNFQIVRVRDLLMGRTEVVTLQWESEDDETTRPDYYRLLISPEPLERLPVDNITSPLDVVLLKGASYSLNLSAVNCNGIVSTYMVIGEFACTSEQLPNQGHSLQNRFS